MIVPVFSFDKDMQTLSSIAPRYNDELFHVFMEMRGHLYLHSATLLLKLAQDSQQTWRAVSHLAALCYLLASQVITLWPATSRPECKQSLCYYFQILTNEFDTF